MKNRGFIKIFIILFSFFLQNMISFGETREVPNIIIKDNPEKEVYQIDTIKRRTKPAELNLTVTKIKTEEILVKIDKQRNIIFADLKGVSEKNIYPLENLEDLPTPNTSKGRRAINRFKSKNLDKNLEVKRYELNSKEKKTRLEIKYKSLPKDIFLVTMDKNSFKTNKIYRARFLDYNSPKGNNVSVKIWIFGEEMGSLTNLVINPSNNSTGNIEIRENGEYSYPENAVAKVGLHTVFDMSGQPLEFEFEDDDKIELEKVAGTITAIKNNQGSFYKERNKYAECTIPGYNLKTRIWSDSNKIEFSLNKTNKNDGYVKFKIRHKTSDGTIRQEINVEIYINNKAFDDYFQKLISYSRVYNFRELYESPDDSSGKSVYEIYTDEGARVTDFISDRVDYKIITPTRISPIKVRQTWGERDGERKHKSYSKIESLEEYGFGNSTTKKVKASVGRSLVKVYTDWIDPWQRTTQYFEFEGSYLSYCKEKRKIWLKNTVGVTDGYFNSFGTYAVGTIVGLPIKNRILNSSIKNGTEFIIEFNEGNRFYVAKKQDKSKSDFHIFLNGLERAEDDLMSKGAVFGISYSDERDGFEYYNIVFRELELKKTSRTFVLVGRDGVYYNSNEIIVPAFNPEILINKATSSLKNDIVRYIDVSEKFDNEYIRPIDLGEIYFNKYDDISILRNNSSKSPYVSLPNHVYLEDIDDGTRIEVNLSFDKNSDLRILDMSNYKTFLKEGGGNGSKIYLKLSPDAYQEIIKYGGGKTYILKGGNINVGINIDKVLVTGSPAGKIEKKLVSNVTIRTRKVEPLISTIKFVRGTPLLKDSFFSLEGSRIQYLRAPSDGYNYNNTLQLIGNVGSYNYTTKKHNYELVDDSGRVIKGFISSNGNGGYWENLDIGNGNTITLSQGKDAKTYMSLTNWNYEETKGVIAIKHYIQSSSDINQYFKFYFELPQFDPYTYYNKNSNTIKLNEDIEKNITSSNLEIELGEVALENVDMNITIKNSGNKMDGEGVRIEKQVYDLDILKLGTNMSTGKKAIIKLVDENNQEIDSGKIVGKDKRAKVILEIPRDLSRTNSYEIKSRIGKNRLFDNNEDGYILKIGRNGYWKEIINKITLKGLKKLDGSATLKISNSYKENSKITFETIDYDSLNTSKLKDPVPEGVTLENREGYGMLKGKSGDKAYIKYKSENIGLGNLDSSGNTSVKSINLDSGNKIEVQYKNGEFVINLVKRKLGVQFDEDISICLNRGNDQVLEFKLKISIEESWFKILNKEILDFGDVIVGSKNLDAKASIVLETSDGIQFENIKIKLKDSKIPLYPVSTPNVKDLEAHIVYYELKKESTKNRYKVDVEGKLDTQDTSKVGEQKGTAEFIIEIKE